MASKASKTYKKETKPAAAPAPDTKPDQRTGGDLKVLRGPGHPRTIEDGNDLIKAWEEYLSYIRSNNFNVYPSKTEFCKRYGCDRRTVYLTLYEYYPNIKKDFDDLLSECLSDGVNAGVYNVTFTIFILKNRCGWADKQEQTNVDGGKSEKLIDKEEAAEKLKEYAKKIV